MEQTVRENNKTLYSPKFEHDNCGIGAVVNIKGIKSHDTVANALTIVETLEHRAGKDAEGKTGDGVGILLQISHKFFKKAAAEIGIKLGSERDYAVGMFFFPQNELARNQAKKMFEIIAEKEGLTESDLYNAASKNTKELFPVSIKNMNEGIGEMIFGESGIDEEMQKEFSEVMQETPDENCMYVITNESKLFGAASMLYEEPIHELAEQVGGDLYILPSSVHEVIAVPADFDSPEELAEMVYEINME